MATKKVLRTIPEMEAKVREYIFDWASFTGVNHIWTIHLSFVKEKELDSEDSAAETNWASSYTSATIKFNTDHMKAKQLCDCELEEISAHEIGHLLDSAIWDWAFTNLNGAFRRTLVDLLEKQCDIWTRVAIRARYGDDWRCAKCVNQLPETTEDDVVQTEEVNGDSSPIY